MVKVAYLLGSLNRGGAEVLLLDIFRNAKAYNLNAIGIYRKPGVLEPDFFETSLPIYCLPTSKNVISYLLQLRSLLSKNAISIIHAQQPIDALYGLIASIGTGRKVLLTLHGYDFNDSGLSRLILRFVLRSTTLNLYVSCSQRRYYEKKYHLKFSKQQVVYNGISFDKLEPYYNQVGFLNRSEIKSLNSTLRGELRLSTDAFLIGTVGNFNTVRDQLTICHFLKDLSQVTDDFHFVFVGKRVDSFPHLYDACVDYCEENGLSKHVTFLGSRSDVPEILGQLDGFIYSTNHDSFGIGVVEAMAMGLAVFVNDWEVMSEITRHGEYATLYKTKDTADLLKCFLLFMTDRVTYGQKSKISACIVRELFGIEKHIANLMLIYNDIAFNNE